MCGGRATGVCAGGGATAVAGRRTLADSLVPGAFAVGEMVFAGSGSVTTVPCAIGAFVVGGRQVSKNGTVVGVVGVCVGGNTSTSGIVNSKLDPGAPDSIQGDLTMMSPPSIRTSVCERYNPTPVPPIEL